MKSPSFLQPGALVLFASACFGTLQAATLISDDFASVGSGSDINGRTPSLVDGSLSGIQWTATTANFYGDGAGGLAVSMSSTTNRSIGIDLGAGYFDANAGVHEISLSIQRTSASSALSWVGLGFGASLDVAVNQTQTGSAGQPWMLNRMSGSTAVYQGLGAANAFGNNVTTNQTMANTFTMRLDTSGANWTLAAFINGVPMDLNGALGGETLHTYVTNPANLRYFIISSGFNTDAATAVIDNFSYSFTPVPEPSALMLGAVSALALFRRRR